MSKISTDVDTPDPSGSAVQREIESVMLRRLEEQHTDWHRVIWKAVALELGLSSIWQKAAPDAVWKTESGEIIIAESYARVGELKPGHRRKLAMDALKLLAIKQTLPEGKNVRYLLIVPEELTGKLNSGSWFSAALRISAEIVPVTLLKNEKQKLSDATNLQAQGQARTTKTRKPPTND